MAIRHLLLLTTYPIYMANIIKIGNQIINHQFSKGDYLSVFGGHLDFMNIHRALLLEKGRYRERDLIPI